MLYTSKRNKFKNFIKTRNLKYYLAFLALLAAVICVIVIFSHRNKLFGNNSDETKEPTTVVQETSSETEAVLSVSGKYKLCLNTSTGMLSIHEWNPDISYFEKKPFKFMICSVSDNIKAGEYEGVEDNLRELWHPENDLFYRYYVEFPNGISFHSSAYEEKNNAGSIVPESYAQLNSGSSEYGITLLVADAKWIYENCSNDSVIKVYGGTDEVPDEASYYKYLSLPENVRWDPTDTASDSPWCRTKVKSLTSPDVLSLKLNAPDAFMMSFAQALDENDSDISDHVYVTGTYDNSRPGVYSLTYNLIDIYGNHLTKNVSVTIEEPETETPSVSETGIETTEPASTGTELENTMTDDIDETANSNETVADNNTISDNQTQKETDSPDDASAGDDTDLQ